MRFWGKHRSALIAFGVMAAAFLFFSLSGIGCPIKFLFGISCPGCGMTRAAYSLFALDIADAFYYHPLWPAVPAAALLLVFFKLKKRERTVEVILLAFALLLLFGHIARMIFFPSDIASFNIGEGFVARFFENVIDKCI